MLFLIKLLNSSIAGLVFNWSPVYQNTLETDSFSPGETNSCRSRYV